MKIIKHPIEFYAERIATDFGFSLQRWGDGEMGHLLGYMHGKDANGHQYFPQLQRDLESALIERLTNPTKFSYQLAMQDLGYRMFEKDWNFLLTDNGSIEPWHDSTTFLDAIVEIKLQPLIDAINTRNIVMVAPGFLIGHAPFKVATWINVPEKDCYLSMAQIASDIITVAACAGDNPLVLLSCGMAAKPIMHRVYDTISNSMNGSIWDFGSMWDPFAGRKSRSPYMNLPLDYANNYK